MKNMDLTDEQWALIQPLVTNNKYPPACPERSESRDAGRGDPLSGT
jgi:transposase